MPWDKIKTIELFSKDDDITVEKEVIYKIDSSRCQLVRRTGKVVVLGQNIISQRFEEDHGTDILEELDLTAANYFVTILSSYITRLFKKPEKVTVVSTHQIGTLMHFDIKSKNGDNLHIFTGKSESHLFY